MPNILPDSFVLHRSVTVHRITQLGLRSHPTGSIAHEALTTTLSFIRSDKLVFSTVSIRPFSPCQPTQVLAGPIFSHIRNPYPAFPGGVHNFYRHLYPGLGLPHGGLSDFGYLDLFRMQDPRQCFGAQGGSTGPPSLGLSIAGTPGYDRYRQHHCCSLDQQTGWDPFPYPVVAGSRSVSMATDSRYSHSGLTHSGLPKCVDWLSRLNQPITTEWRLHPEIVNQIFQTWGTPAVDIFATVHNTHLPQFISPVLEPRALAIDAVSHDWQGRSMYLFLPFPLLSKVIQKLRTIQEGELILIAPGGHHNRGFHTYMYYVCVWTTHILPYRRDLLSQQRQVIPSAHMESLMQHYQAAGFSKEVSRLAAASLQIKCMATGGFASFTGHRARI